MEMKIPISRVALRRKRDNVCLADFLKHATYVGWMEEEVLAYMISIALRHGATGNDEESCNTFTWLQGTTLESNLFE